MAKKPLNMLSREELLRRIDKAEPYSPEWEDLIVENDIRYEMSLKNNPLAQVINAIMDEEERKLEKRLRLN